MSNHKLDLLCFFLLTLTIPLFFYKLGQSSLADWDEAWYADIARTISQSADLSHLKWNGLPYLDHPPFGFWVEAISFKLFGITEFAARFPQALSALFSLYIVYLLGKELFNRPVGIASAVALTSAFWFISRARSGNLDILLTLLFLLTIFLSFKDSKNPKYFPYFVIILFGLFLTKTLIPLTLIPSMVVIFWKKKLTDKGWEYMFISAFLVLAYFTYQTLTYPQFLKSLVSVGLRGVELKSSYLTNLVLIKDYLYAGVGRWFWPGVLGLFITLLLRQKRLLILAVFALSFILPFLFSQKAQIWHLIPLSPVWILLFFGGFFALFEKYFYKKRYSLFILILIPAFFIYKNQITRIWYEQIDIPPYVSDIAILAKEASKYPYPLFTDGDFDPTARFYSKKIVKKIQRSKINELFLSKDSFLLITSQWRIEEANIDPKSFQILTKDRDKVLILKNNI